MINEPVAEQQTPGKSLSEKIQTERSRNWIPVLLLAADVSRWNLHNPVTNGTPPIPYLTDGPLGFIDQHIGNAFPTVLLYGFFRLPIEVGAKFLETFTSHKLSDRAKVYAALSLASIWPILQETPLLHTGGTADSLDHFGTVVATIAISGGFEFAEFMSKPVSNKMKDKFKVFGESIERIARTTGEKMFPTT